MFDFLLKKRQSRPLPAVLAAEARRTSGGPAAAPGGSLEGSEPSLGRAQPGWTVYVADVDGLLDWARVSGRVN